MMAIHLCDTCDYIIQIYQYISGYMQYNYTITYVHLVNILGIPRY